MLFSQYKDEGYENNKLLLSANPLLCIALSCELLDKISNIKKKYKNLCDNQKEALLCLGKYYNRKIESTDVYRNLMNDTDFQNRSLLKIITLCKFHELLSDENSNPENLMNEIFVG